jgi:hypothetical protein
VLCKFPEKASFSAMAEKLNNNNHHMYCMIVKNICGKSENFLFKKAQIFEGEMQKNAGLVAGEVAICFEK